MGRFLDLLGTVASSFGIGAKGSRATFDASGVTADRTITLPDKAGTIAIDRSIVTALSIASGVVNIDCSLGDYFTLALTANVTSITFSNVPASGTVRTLCIDVKQDATGSRTVAIPSAFKALGSSDTAVQSAANAKTRIIASTVDGGTTWPYSMAKVAA